jgi:hypothetical protein
VGHHPHLLASIGALQAALLMASAVHGAPLRHDRRTGTSIHLYSPFAAAGPAAGVHIARSAAGSCWTSSLADPRSDAWRCLVGNYIHDPCFSNEINPTDYVLCPQYTPGDRLLRINLTKTLPRSSNTSGDPTRYPPWAVQTTGGKWCTILTGATGLIAGMRINYGCAGRGYLLGNPRRQTAIWTIFYAARYDSNQLMRVPLASAWW